MASISRGTHLSRVTVSKPFNWFSIAIVTAVCIAGSLPNAAEPSSVKTFENKPFYHNSLRKIESSYLGQPFLLSVWSRECAPCIKELATLARLKAEYPALNLVLISTDPIENTSETNSLLTELGHPNTVNSWAYADEQAEKLRYSIDKNWYGEMPRSYFYDSKGKRKATSGLLSEALLRNWIHKSVKPR